MEHILNFKNGQSAVVTINCGHPDIFCNTCPTGMGNCDGCRFCNAVMSAEDFFRIQQILRDLGAFPTPKIP